MATTQVKPEAAGIQKIILHMPDSVDSELSAIQQIRGLDSNLTPYLIAALQDYRDLPEKSFQMIPGAGADRNMPARQVHVPHVSALLMRLLEEKTGESFGLYFYDFEVKGADEISINRWRHWCESKYPDFLKTCWNEKNGVREVVRARKLGN